MKTFGRIAVAALAATSLSVSAQAQAPDTLSEQLRIETRDFAACVAEKRPEQALRLLGLSLSSSDYRLAALTLLRQTSCAKDPEVATFDPLLLSGALAEIALEKNIAHEVRSEAAAANPADPALAMADCAVRAEPAKAETLLATAWLSDDELDAAHGLAPALKPCIVDPRIAIDAAQLRALIALAKLRSTAA